MTEPKYNRIMLKLSGEVLRGEGKNSNHIDPVVLDELCDDIIEISQFGVEIALVIGGGNIWRFRDSTDTGIERVVSDHIGMLATIMNALAMQSTFERKKVDCRVASSIAMPQVCEPYLRRKSLRHLEKKRILICAGGTGSPYFTTDSAAALRALELKCNIMLKATNVDGVYEKDPDHFPNAKKFDSLSYHDVMEMDLSFMDQAAVALCKESNLPILVFDLQKKGNIRRAVFGEKIGTLIH